MLRSLQIRNYVLIDSLDIDFPAGLVIITGQTGAGKSIILGALSLLLGAKADASMVGENAENCIVEGEFQVKDDPAIREVLESSGMDWNGGNFIIRRVLGKSGRSRSFVNDEPVTVGMLSEIAGRLIDIHSQHETLLLADKSYQLSILDHYAGNAGLLDSCSSAYRNVVSLRGRLSEVEEKLRKLSLEKDFNQSLFDKLESANLRDGELEELEEEQKILANAEELKENFFNAENILSGSDDRDSVDSMLKEASRQLEKAGKFVEKAVDLSKRLESSRLEIEDILAEVTDLEGSTEVSGERLEFVEDRMSLLYDLLKKHGCRTVAELIAEKDALSQALYDSTALEEEKAGLEKSLAEGEKALKDAAAKLHESRLKARKPFAEAIEKSIHFLELDNAVFDVEISDVAVGASGSDAVQFLFSSTGKNPVDVAKCASGGEMSRIMLCLKAMMARYANMPTLIFDEIDTGVSGSVADKMGSMICEMGKDMQVFAITHLPQVAAKGDAHYLVTKSSSEGRTVTGICNISGEDRIQEIARMLSGAQITAQARENAKALLEEA
ncbi:MAG: DNA repair protein RecN [Bacteroidota bacterium]|nr:DNA repair protein RecN [Bacteroidota bacterium]